MEQLQQTCKAYQGKAIDQRQEAAAQLRRHALAFSPSDAPAALASGDPTDNVRALLLGTRAGLVQGESGVDASRAAALRLAVYKHALGLLPGDGLSEGETARLVSVLDSELSSMVSPVDISEVVEAAVEVFESDCTHACAALDLLPKALILLASMGGQVDLPRDGGNAAACQVSDFCQGIVRRVCQHDWPLPRIAKVLRALRDFPLTQDSLVEVVKKGALRSKAADMHDLPSIVHQLLMLSVKGSRDIVLLEVVRLFEQREAALANSTAEGAAVARRQLLEVEGSVLLHMDMAAKHDAELGQAWLRYLRSEAPRCSPFMLAVSFMLAAIQRFEQPVTDALKALVMGALKDAAALATSPWLPTQQGQAADCPTGTSYTALSEALLQCVRNSAHGQGGIVQPMAQLAVALMESVGDKGACYHPDGSLESTGTSPAAQACNLGMNMLLELFRGQKEFRRDVVAICHNRLIGAKEDAAAPFVRLIALLVRQEGALMAEYMNDFKVSLENLAFLPPNAALSLLLAVWPLCRARRDVQDYVIMLLRKAMFSREVHARLLAARGFLYMIIEELNAHGAVAPEPSAWNRAGTSSSSQLSQMSALSGGPGGATLLHELMSFLRRCLSQQAEVRRALYDGMPAVLAVDPSAQECVVEPLLPHFCLFYEADEQLTPPLKLELCARLQGDGEGAAVRVVEPLQHMLAGLRRVLRVAAAPPATGTEADNFNLMGTDLSDLGGAEAGAVAEALRKNFQSLRTRLVACTLEDFQIDQSTDFTCGSPAGDLSHATADILLGCMEVMMEDLVDEIAEGGGSSSERLAADLMTLFQQHQRLIELAAHCKSGGKGKKVEGLTQAVGGRKGPGRPAAGAVKGAATVPPSVDKRVPALSISCLCKLLDAITDDCLGGTGTGGAGAATMPAQLKVARDTQFQTFVLSSALRVLQACRASDANAAIATGTAGSEEDGEAVRELLAVPAWQELALPLFRAVQTVVLAGVGQRVVVAAGAKKEKDPTEPLTQAALKALEQLLSMGRTAAGVAQLLKDVPLPDQELAREAALPAVQGLPDEQRTISQQLPHFKQLLDTLVEHCCGRELESLCALLQQLVGLLPAGEATRVGAWAEEACQIISAQMRHPGAAKGLVTLALRCGSQSGGDIKLLGQLAEELKELLSDSEADESDAYPIVNNGTIAPVAGVLVSYLESLLSNLDWVFSKLKSMSQSGKEWGREPSLRQSQLRMKWEEETYRRLQKLVEVTGVLVEAPLSGSICEALVKACTHLYKVLGTAAKAQFAPKGVAQAAPCRAFQDVVAAVNRSCTGQVYNFIYDMHEPQHENDAAAGNAGEESEGAAKKRGRALATAANRAKRASKLIPNLIFQVEDYEKQLIRLSKTGKLNLMLTAKRSTNRHFQLKMAEGGQPQGGARQAKRAKPVEEEAEPEDDEEMAAGEEVEQEAME